MASNLQKVLNTMVNPFSSDTLNPDWFKPFGGSRKGRSANRMLLHILGLMATYGGGAYLARSAGDKSRAKEDKDFQAKLEALLNAQEGYMNPDPDLKDTAAEKKRMSLGIPKFQDSLNKESSEKEAFDPRNYSMLLPVLSIIMATKIGYGMADRKLDKRREEQLDTDIADAENLYQAKNYERLLKAKGLSKSEVAEQAKAMGKSASEKVAENRGTIGFLTAAAMLAAGMSAYVGYQAGNKYFKSTDPKRIQRKKLMQEAEDMFRAEAPAQIIPDFDPKLKAILNSSGVKPAKKKAPKKSLALNNETTDPASDILSKL